MHPTAHANCQQFYDVYLSNPVQKKQYRVIEIGSLDLNGNLRDIFPASIEYLGVDFAPGKGVDVVLKDPYSLPFSNNEFDVLITSSCLEHSEMFWLVFLEIMRILKPDGLCYINVPANGGFHRHPVDCWRFYPDSGKALVTWAKRNNYNAALVESFTSHQIGDLWNDFVAVFIKDESQIESYPKRMLEKKQDFMNGYVYGDASILKLQPLSEDQVKLDIIRKITENSLKVI